MNMRRFDELGCVTALRVCCVFDKRSVCSSLHETQTLSVFFRHHLLSSVFGDENSRSIVQIQNRFIRGRRVNHVPVIMIIKQKKNITHKANKAYFRTVLITAMFFLFVCLFFQNNLSKTNNSMMCKHFFIFIFALHHCKLASSVLKKNVTMFFLSPLISLMHPSSIKIYIFFLTQTFER